MFTSSLLVSATKTSVSREPAASSVDGYAPLPDERADIQPVLQVAQQFFVGIDDGDFVGFFTRQMRSRRPAHLAGAEDDDFHCRSPPMKTTGDGLQATASEESAAEVFGF